MKQILKEINFYYENYNIYRTIIILSDFSDINLFKSFLDKNYCSYIITDKKTDISNIDERIILIKNNNKNIKKILNQISEYNLLLFYDIDSINEKYIENFFLLN